jgi:hypothetical protein
MPNGWLKSHVQAQGLTTATDPVRTYDPVDDYNALTLARYDSSAALSADLGSTTIWTDQGVGSRFYKISGYTVTTVAATTGASTSTMPAIVVTYTDADSNTSVSITLGTNSTANAVGTVVQATAVIHVVAKGTIVLTTSGYASNTASQMKFMGHAALTRL